MILYIMLSRNTVIIFSLVFLLSSLSIVIFYFKRYAKHFDKSKYNAKDIILSLFKPSYAEQTISDISYTKYKNVISLSIEVRSMSRRALSELRNIYTYLIKNENLIDDLFIELEDIEMKIDKILDKKRKIIEESADYLDTKSMDLMVDFFSSLNTLFEHISVIICAERKKTTILEYFPNITNVAEEQNKRLNMISSSLIILFKDSFFNGISYPEIND